MTMKKASRNETRKPMNPITFSNDPSSPAASTSTDEAMIMDAINKE